MKTVNVYIHKNIYLKAMKAYWSTFLLSPFLDRDPFFDPFSSFVKISIYISCSRRAAAISFSFFLLKHKREREFGKT